MDWLSNPVVWIAIALIGLAIIAVLLLPLLRRPAQPRTASAEPAPAPAEASEPAAAKSETRTSMRREPRSRRPALDIAAVGESAEAQPPAIAETPVKPTPKAATPPPKPIDELLKNIDFNLGEERPRTAPEGQGAARRIPDAEPPTASVTRTPGLSAPPPAPAPTPKPAPPAAPPATPPASVEPLSELPTGLQFDKLDFDLSDLGLDSTRKPAELPPLELKPKPAAPAAQIGAKSAAPAPSDDWATLDFNLPDLTPPPPAAPAAAQPSKPKPDDLKFQLNAVDQEQGRSEELARLDEELQSFGGELDLGKMNLDSPGPGTGEAGVGYIETKLDLAAAYLDMGDQVGARGLLEDVLQEGNAAQKKQAEDLLKKLG